jgi:hypothetical protein
MTDETQIIPKTDQELGDAIWNYHQSVETERFTDLLSDLLTAGKLELAIELMKLRELERISNELEEIQIDGLKLSK